jgi:hypothetical protein
MCSEIEFIFSSIARHNLFSIVNKIYYILGRVKLIVKSTCYEYFIRRLPEIMQTFRKVFSEVVR